jgi:hypothetical protein
VLASCCYDCDIFRLKPKGSRCARPVGPAAESRWTPAARLQFKVERGENRQNLTENGGFFSRIALFFTFFLTFLQSWIEICGNSCARFPVATAGGRPGTRGGRSGPSGDARVGDWVKHHRKSPFRPSGGVPDPFAIRGRAVAKCDARSGGFWIVQTPAERGSKILY